MDGGPSSELTDDGDDEQLDNMLFTEDEIVNAIYNYKTSQPVFKEKPYTNNNNVIGAANLEHNYAQSSKVKGTSSTHNLKTFFLLKIKYVYRYFLVLSTDFT